MDLFCISASRLHLYMLSPQNTDQFCPQQRVVLDSHMTRQRLFPAVSEAEIDLYGTAVKDVAEQVFYPAHLGAVQGWHRQEVTAGPLPALFPLYTFRTVRRSNLSTR